VSERIKHPWAHIDECGNHEQAEARQSSMLSNSSQSVVGSCVGATVGSSNVGNIVGPVDGLVEGATLGFVVGLKMQ